MIKNLENLFEVVKPNDNVIKKDMRLLKIGDQTGWTNGYMADLTNWYLPKVEAKAKLKGIEFEANKPNIKPLLDQAKESNHEVESIEFDLTSKTAILKNSSIKAYVNPDYLAYFQKAYKELGGISKLVLTGERTSVKVYNRDQLIGLVMPINIQA